MSSLDAVGSAASFLLLTRLNYFFVQLFHRGRFEARALLRRCSGRRRRGGEEEERRGREVKNSCSFCQNSKSTEFSQNLVARSAQSLLWGPWKVTDLRQQNFFSLPQPMHFCFLSYQSTLRLKSLYPRPCYLKWKRVEPEGVVVEESKDLALVLLILSSITLSDQTNFETRIVLRCSCILYSLT